MQLAIIATPQQREEWMQATAGSTVSSLFYSTVEEVAAGADAVFDLDFTFDPGRIAVLEALQPAAIFINSVPHTLQEIGQPFVRINAWPGFLQRGTQEIAFAGEGEAPRAVLQALQWSFKQVPDIRGLITPRVIAMIVNEAYYALGEGVSTKEEIDTAMKLGTNYPKGPFEWSNQVGLKKIYDLLIALQHEGPRYTIAPALAAAVQQ